VGVAVGEIVVTRIGLTNANEVTAYGPPVNQACKLSGKIIGIRLTKGAHDVYPTAKGGRVKFEHYDGGYFVNFPSDMFMLERDANQIGRRRPR